MPFLFVHKEFGLKEHLVSQSLSVKTEMSMILNVVKVSKFSYLFSSCSISIFVLV